MKEVLQKPIVIGPLALAGGLLLSGLDPSAVTTPHQPEVVKQVAKAPAAVDSTILIGEQFTSDLSTLIEPVSVDTSVAQATCPEQEVQVVSYEELEHRADKSVREAIVALHGQSGGFVQSLIGNVSRDTLTNRDVVGIITRIADRLGALHREATRVAQANQQLTRQVNSCSQALPYLEGENG